MTDTYPERVAEIKKNKSRDGYGPALAKIFDELPDEQKPSFVFEAKEIDPLRTAFGAGHAATSSLLTFALMSAPILFLSEMQHRSQVAGLSLFCSFFVFGAAGAVGSDSRKERISKYRMMDVEYAMWRMKQVEKGEIAPIKAFGAGLLNGFKHNAVSMMARGVAVAVVGALWAGAKGLSVASRSLLGSSEISRATGWLQSTSDKLASTFQAIPGESHNLVEDWDYNAISTGLCLIRLEAQSNARQRRAKAEAAALKAG